MTFHAITQTKAWQKLTRLQGTGGLPAFDGSLVKSWSNWQLDLTRAGWRADELELLIEAAQECQLGIQIQQAFRGEKINFTEGRAVLHMALRDNDESSLTPKDARQLAKNEMLRLQSFVQKIRAGDITDVVNIGIGGSDLGPKLLSEALRPFASGPQVHYVSNVDPNHLSQTLKNLNPASTLFIIVSKTFTTQETMTNALRAKNWGQNEAQFAAVTTASDKAKDFGIVEEHIFTFWDWVGGRYSLWSAVGLSSMLSLGDDIFMRVLNGANQMDKHFIDTEYSQNIPLLLALWDIWNVNLRDYSNVALLPYEQNLESFARWFQQLAMESNGKSVDRNGKSVAYKTCPVYWGEAGTNGQHAFYQLLHQGTWQTPCEFIGFAKSSNADQAAHQLLLANMLAQAKAFAEGADGADAFRDFSGQRPSVTLLGDQATPERVGELLAMYEHRVMAQGFLWNIPSFDQWGVELGKKLTKELLADWASGEKQDLATQRLLATIRKFS